MPDQKPPQQNSADEGKPNEKILDLMKQHPEIDKRREEERQKMIARQHKIIDEFLPAIERSVTGLLSSGKVASGLSDVIHMGMTTLAQKTKLKDLGIIEHLEKFTQGDPNKEAMFAEQKKLVEELGEWTVADAFFAIQWFSAMASKKTEELIKDAPLSDMISDIMKVHNEELKRGQNEKGVLSPIQPILGKEEDGKDTGASK